MAKDTREKPEFQTRGLIAFVTFIDAKGKLLGHFDAGWPISYNAHTAPANTPAITGSAPVIVSHWD